MRSRSPQDIIALQGEIVRDNFETFLGRWQNIRIGWLTRLSGGPARARKPKVTQDAKPSAFGDAAGPRLVQMRRRDG
jgi:hypothetical protein